nr:GDP-mannose 4,6-dehydratase [Treponema sp.]
MARKLHNILVTGGCGFIGSNFINYLLGLSTSGEACFKDANFTGRIINVDCLTYAGNPENLAAVEKEFGKAALGDKARYIFEKVDICDRAEIERIFKAYDIDTVIHFAAESHVDRSI